MKEKSAAELLDERGYAPLDSEIFALIDSIGASYIVQDGIVIVELSNGEVWDFTVPMKHSS